MPIQNAIIQDYYNPSKYWIIKRTKCRHYLLAQQMEWERGQVEPKFRRLGLKHIKNIGLLGK
jgi:hypothetical protein